MHPVVTPAVALFSNTMPPPSLEDLAGAGHTGGVEAHPAEYERRVVGFFDRALRER